jgi:RNA polymerase primary sigma factor
MVNEQDIKSTFLQSLYGIEPLSTAEEHALAERIQQGDDEALDKLVLHNLRFVSHLVTKMTAWQHGKVPMEDMLAMGNEQLLIAARRWKPTNNAKFATYAKSFILKGVRRELDNTSNIIRLPVNIAEALKKLNYNERALSQVLGRKPTVQELATILDTTTNKIHQLKGYISREPVSLDSITEDRQHEEQDE